MEPSTLANGKKTSSTEMALKSGLTVQNSKANTFSARNMVKVSSLGEMVQLTPAYLTKTKSKD